ncbi:hypothetical protein KI387_021907, partial [Taxus chinensis]
ENTVVDLNTTALGFRILRLNGYIVSPDVFHKFINENGKFIYHVSAEEGDSHLRSMLSLYRASEISFPGEKIMREAKSFASRYLQQALERRKELTNTTQLLAEVEYVIKYSWRCKVPRWEAWNSIQILRQDIDTWTLIEGMN